MSGEDRRAPSTRFTRDRGPRGEAMSQDPNDALARLFGILVLVGVGVMVLPAFTVGAVLVMVWAWRRWPVWWMLPGLVPIVGVAWWRAPLGDRFAAVWSGLEFASPWEWVGLWGAGLPETLGLSVVGAAAVVWWHRMREPSWNEDGRPERGAAKRAKVCEVALASTVVEAGQVLLGIDERSGRAAGVPLPTTPGDYRHTLILGSTGSGKTTTGDRLGSSVLTEGGGLLIVDLKGDPEMVGRWEAHALAAGRTFRVWSFDHQTVYDPLGTGSLSERVRKIMALGDWTESAFYASHAELILQLLLRAMDEAGVRVTLASIAGHLTVPALASFGNNGPDGHALRNAVSDPTRERLSALESLRTKIDLLVTSDHGPWLDPDRSGFPSLHIGAALEAGDVVVVSLNELKHGHIASRMAEVFLVDVASVAGDRVARKVTRPAMVWVDEFSAMDPAPLASLFARVRSANIALLLSTQEVSDLQRQDPTFRSRVATNVACIIVHRIHDPESVEWVAGVFGTRDGFQETSQVQRLTRLGPDPDAGGSTGLGTIREVKQYLVAPDDLRGERSHSAWVGRLDRKAADGRAQLIRVVKLSAGLDVAAATGFVPDELLALPAGRPSEAAPAHNDASSRHGAASMGSDDEDLPGATW